MTEAKQNLVITQGKSGKFSKGNKQKFLFKFQDTDEMNKKKREKKRKEKVSCKEKVFIKELPGLDSPKPVKSR